MIQSIEIHSKKKADAIVAMGRKCGRTMYYETFFTMTDNGCIATIYLLFYRAI